jgi:outer membrane protein assembly factor BamB
MLLADLDGDTVADVIGRVRYVIGGDTIRAAAYSGATGVRLWESPPIGTYLDTYQGVMGRHGDLLLFADARGHAFGLGLHDGKLRWKTTVSERVVRMCGEANHVVRLTLADETVHRLHADDGTARVQAEDDAAPTSSDTCQPIALDRSGGVFSRLSLAHDVEVPGMRVHAVIGSSSALRIALGSRAKGTSVPMIAVLDGKKVRWSSDAPAGDLLRVSPFAPEHAVVAGDRVFMIYGMDSGTVPHHVVAFDVDNGRRLWDVPLADRMPIGGMEASANRLFVAQWGHLEALDPETGKRLYAIGSFL